MKANLETFPKPKPIYDVWDENNPDDFDYDKKEIEKWKRDFEAELQQMRAIQEEVLAKVPKRLRSKDHLVSIEEALGERQ